FVPCAIGRSLRNGTEHCGRREICHRSIWAGFREQRLSLCRSCTSHSPGPRFLFGPSRYGALCDARRQGEVPMTFKNSTMTRRSFSLRGLLAGGAVTVGVPLLEFFLDANGKALAASVGGGRL